MYLSIDAKAIGNIICNKSSVNALTSPRLLQILRVILQQDLERVENDNVARGAIRRPPIIYSAVTDIMVGLVLCFFIQFPQICLAARRR